MTNLPPLPSPLPQGARERTRAAFTLAEVLITLGIIGVVAAMTIPTLMTKIQEKELYSAYMRVYSILNQAYLHAEEEFGDYSGWEGTSADDYEKIKPFLKFVQDCPVGQTGKKCFPSDDYKSFNGGPYTLINANEITRNFPALRLISGESILFARNQHLVTFMVDLNSNKKPNQLGVDLHLFSIYKLENNMQYKVLPGSTWGEYFKTRWQYCARNVVSGTEDGIWSPGSGCGFWILKHGNMDYLHMTDEQIKQNW